VPTTFPAETAADALPTDDVARRRLSLYKVYLATIMCTERPTRGFAGPEHERPRA
jgi:hypothetical protein